MEPDTQDTEHMFAQRLAQLPPVVRNAIAAADVEKRLRGLADFHKLHVDQWQLLENEVKLALLGFEDAANLPENLQNVVGLDAESAASLARDVSASIFEPIREELERQLGNPEAHDDTPSPVEAVRQHVLAEAQPPQLPQVSAPPSQTLPQDVPQSTNAIVPETSASLVPQTNTHVHTQAVVPATPPPVPPQDTARRAPLAEGYHPHIPSTERPQIEGDPYREQIG